MANMEVILLERIERLGQMGDVVRVKPGYARNFLLPKKKALRATKDNLSYFESRRADLEAANLKRREEAEAVAARMTDLTIVMIRQAGESGQLYGSVTARDLAEAITEAGFHVERNQLMMTHPIKQLGIHDERVALHPEVIVAVRVNVAQSEEEAEVQARRGGSAVQLGERPEDMFEEPEEETLPEGAEELFDSPPEESSDSDTA